MDVRQQMKIVGITFVAIALVLLVA